MAKNVYLHDILFNLHESYVDKYFLFIQLYLHFQVPVTVLVAQQTLWH